MANQKRPTAAQLRYLLVMREVSEDGAVHSVDVARALGVRKPSVYSIMNAFSEAGWIEKGRYGAAVFTEEGRRLLNRYASACYAVEDALTAHFPTLSDVRAVACTLLSELSDESLDALAGAETQAPPDAPFGTFPKAEATVPPDVPLGASPKTEASAKQVPKNTVMQAEAPEFLRMPS